MAYLDKFSTLNQVDRDPSLTDAFDASKSTEIVSNNLATVYNGATLAVENLGLPSAVFSTHSLATAATGAVPGAVTGTAAFYNFANQLSNVVRADLATDKGLLSGSVFKLDSGNKNVYTASASATDAAGKVTTVKVTEATAGTDPFNGNGSIKEVVNYTGTQGEKLTVNNAISAVTTANSDSYNTARSEILTGKNVLGVLNTTDAHSHSQNAGSEVLKNASAMSYNYTDSNLTVIANIKDAYARNTTSNGVETIQQSDAANVSYNLTVPAIVTAPVGTPTHKVSLVYSAARNVAQTTDAAGVQKTTVITSLPSFKFSDTTTGLSITANSVTTNVTGQAEKAIGTGVKISVADTTGTYSGSLYSATVKGNFAEFFDQAVFDKAALPATNISAEFAVATGVSGLATPVAKAGTNATATFIGTNADDAITVNSVIDIASKKDVAINGVVNGGAGNDVITGGKGNDVLTGGIGDDALIGGDGNDTLNSFGNASGNDVLTGGNGNDIFNFDQNDTITDFVTGETLNLTFAYSKNDLTNAEKAEEEAAFAASGKGVAITLVATSAKTSDVGVTVDLASVKKVPFIVTGSDKNDVITVTGSSNDSGNDVINGGKGNDIINAGRGADVLTGGAGNDTFVYLQESVAPAALPAADKEARVAGLTDTITDFVSAAKGAAAKPTQANDKIDLSAIDAKPSTAVVTNAVTKVTTGEDAFTFIGTNAFTAGIGGEGQLRYDADTNTLQGNTDSNPATIEFALVLTGVKAADLAAVDFVL